MEALIDGEIAQALRGQPASILLKVNNLEDRALISKLYDAGRAGVQVRLIVRGICCLVTGVRDVSEHIEAISIVDRYLEHTRAYVFHNRGDVLVYLASADWMGRNLDRRVEVAFPLLDPAIKKEMIHLLELQWMDRTKARRLDKQQTDPYLPVPKKGVIVHAQADTWKYLARSSGKGSKDRRST